MVQSTFFLVAVRPREGVIPPCAGARQQGGAGGGCRRNPTARACFWRDRASKMERSGRSPRWEQGYCNPAAWCTMGRSSCHLRTDLAKTSFQHVFLQSVLHRKNVVNFGILRISKNEVLLVLSFWKLPGRSLMDGKASSMCRTWPAAATPVAKGVRAALRICGNDYKLSLNGTRPADFFCHTSELAPSSSKCTLCRWQCAISAGHDSFLSTTALPPCHDDPSSTLRNSPEMPSWYSTCKSVRSSDRHSAMRPPQSSLNLSHAGSETTASVAARTELPCLQRHAPR